MGIFQLNFLMKKLKKFDEISIPEECAKFANEKRRKPTLIIDLNSFMAKINEDKVEMLYGRNHKKRYKIIDNLFKRLSKVADLVFYQDGPAGKQKWENTFKQNRKKCSDIEVIDKVNKKVKLTEIVCDLGFKEPPSIGSGFEFLSELASKYGEHIISVNRECDAEIARYACNNDSVIGVIAEDSDFLIFPGKWRYFSTKELTLKKNELKTNEYNRTALKKFLRLTSAKQMAIFATIAGNDIVTFDEVSHYHRKNNIYSNDVVTKFSNIAKKVRDFENLTNAEISFALLGNKKESMKIAESIKQYEVNFSLNTPETPLLKLCLENRSIFVYATLHNQPLNSAIGFYDRRRLNWPIFHEIAESLIARQIGVIVKAEKQLSGKKFDIKTKRSAFKDIEKHSVTPLLPPFDVPSLIETLDRKKYPEHDNVRIKILKWTCSSSLAKINVTSIPKKYLRHVLTLHFLVAEGFITRYDADIILLTIKEGEENKIPQNYEYPPVVHPRAFQIALLFLDFYIDLEKSFEVAGLLDAKCYQTFEGGWFHSNYLKFSSLGEDPVQHLGDVENYRIYKNLEDKPTVLNARKQQTKSAYSSKVAE